MLRMLLLFWLHNFAAAASESQTLFFFLWSACLMKMWSMKVIILLLFCYGKYTGANTVLCFGFTDVGNGQSNILWVIFFYKAASAKGEIKNANVIKPGNVFDGWFPFTSKQSVGNNITVETCPWFVKSLTPRTALWSTWERLRASTCIFT